MVKYVDTLVGFREFPKEVALCINISGCPNHCIGCHSSYLAEDIGTELTKEELEQLINANSGISCVGFMGGDQDPAYINELARFVKLRFFGVKTGWYSGKQELSKDIELYNWDYIKLGPYIEELGPLNSPTTNQRFYEFHPLYSNYTIGPGWRDETSQFWKNDKNL